MEARDLELHGMSKLPFSQQECISKLSYSIPAYSLVLDDLQKKINTQVPSVIIVTGARGVGKSSVIESFISTKNSDKSSRLIQGSRGMGVSSLLKCIADLASVPHPTDFQDTTESLADLAQNISDVQANFLLFIDNAHSLPVQTLAALTETIRQISYGVNVKIVLVGQPILLERFNQFNEESDIKSRISDMSIKPFTYAETYQYIVSRLYESGWKGSPKDLSRSVIEKIFQQSHGVARRINHIAEYELANLFVKSSVSKFESVFKQFALPSRRTFFLFSGVMLAAGTLHATNILNMSSSYKQQPQKLTEQTHLIDDVQQAEKLVQNNSVEKTDEAEVQNKALEQEKTPVAITSKNTLIKTQEHIHAQEKKIIEEAITTTPLQANKEGAIIANNIAEKKTNAIPSKEERFFSLQQKVEKDTIAMMNYKGFSLQLAAVNTIDQLDRILANKVLRSIDNIRVYQGVRGENPVYVVVLTNYASISSAKEALSTMPKSVKKMHPWIRTSSSIRKDIQIFETMLIV